MNITITLTDAESAAISHGAQEGVEQWVRNAVAGKCLQGSKKLIEEWTPILIADPEVKTLPADESEFIALVTARDDYQSARDLAAVEV